MQRPEMIAYLTEYTQKKGINEGRELALDMIIDTLIHCHIDDNKKVTIIKEITSTLINLELELKYPDKKIAPNANI